MKRILIDEKNKELVEELKESARRYGISVMFYLMREKYNLGSDALITNYEELERLKDTIDTLMKTSNIQEFDDPDDE